MNEKCNTKVEKKILWDYAVNVLNQTDWRLINKKSSDYQRIHTWVGAEFVLTIDPVIRGLYGGRQGPPE
jgi:hypothetical protein